MVKARKGRSGSRPDTPSGRPVYDDLSFHALQAAEKAIKAVYSSWGCVFHIPMTLELLSSLARSSVHLEDDVKAAADSICSYTLLKHTYDEL
jgi:HEPN domain-containing protein